MTVAEAAESRSAAAARWSAARAAAADWASGNAGLRRDQRVAEAKQAVALQPRPQDQPVPNRPTQAGAIGRLIDVYA